MPLNLFTLTSTFYILVNKISSTARVRLSFFRSAFRSALLDLISSEHSDLFGERGRPNGTILGPRRREVAEWKFATLDTDRDGDLERSEVKCF